MREPLNVLSETVEEAKKWWILPGSNQRPKVYETSALTTELRIHGKNARKPSPRGLDILCVRTAPFDAVRAETFAGSKTPNSPVVNNILFPDSKIKPENLS